MSDGRRHSMDIPLSKTLVALKRVRSLRDPETNSMSKFTTLIDNLNWETDSCDGAYLELKNSEYHNLIKSRHLHSHGRKEQLESDSESANGSRIPPLFYSKKTSRVRIGDSVTTRTKQCHELYRERRCKPLDSTWAPHSTNLLEEEVDTYNEAHSQLAERVNVTVINKKPGYGYARNTPNGVEDVARSRIGSPYMTISTAPGNEYSGSTLGLANEEVDVVDSNRSGCGLSSCWSRTPKFRELNHPSDEEDQDHPLLSGRRRVATCRETASYLDSPRSLSQKFRPKSFDEMVGLHVVAQSLINSISIGKVAPVYLFHGPRGTGKTTMARIFAAALNCLSLEEHRPCGLCRECVFFFSGRSRDVKELDAAKLNRRDRLKALRKGASIVPFSSHFKVFIIDECQFLQAETWAAIFNGLGDLPRCVVFVMITSDLDNLPHSSVSRCQRYHFPKIKDADIVCRLQKICMEEALDFDKDALDFVATRSNGSLRDAETMLDQLSLLGKRITVSLAYELIGVVSDDDLLDMLDLALSSDTSNTVRRARELMSSRVDPMQLISQLANLIMDLLAGRCQSGCSEVGRKFFGRHTLAEVGLQKLRHALKILSETEKQLRTSKNQATWLTVALLQLGTGESSSLVDVDDSKSYPKTPYLRDDGLDSTISPKESLKSSVLCACNHKKSNCSERQCDSARKLEAIWRRTIEKCQSNSLKSFLQKEGKLSSVYVNQGLAIAEVEFYHPDHASRAEKSWKVIASSLQHVLGRNVEIRINLVHSTYTSKNGRVKRPSFSLLSCSGRKQEMSDSTMTDENETEASRGEFVEASCAAHEQQSSPLLQAPDTRMMHNGNFCHDKEAVTIRNSDGNALSTGTSTSSRGMHEDLPKGFNLGSESSKEIDEGGQLFCIQEPEYQPSCFAKTLKLRRKFFSYNAAHTICLRIQPQNKLELSLPKKTSFETHFCTNDPYIFCSRSNEQIIYSSGDDDRPRKDPSVNPKLHCWKAPKSSIMKVMFLKYGNRKEKVEPSCDP